MSSLELMVCLRQLEASIPLSWLQHWWKPKAFPDTGLTVACVASRLYALDRAIKYNEDKSEARPPGLRRLGEYGAEAGWLTSFSNMCHVSQVCASEIHGITKSQIMELIRFAAAAAPRSSASAASATPANAP